MWLKSSIWNKFDRRSLQMKLLEKKIHINNLKIILHEKIIFPATPFMSNSMYSDEDLKICRYTFMHFCGRCKLSRNSVKIYIYIYIEIRKQHINIVNYLY